MPDNLNSAATRSRPRNPLLRLRIAHLTLILVLLGILARVVRYILNFPLWGDEAFVAVNFLHRGFADMIRPLEYGQIVPLGFMWATLAVTRVAGLSELALRLVPLVGGIAALLLFWRFVRRNFGPRVTLLALGFLGGSFYAIRHANELKAYSTDLLISIGLTSLAWAVHEKPRSFARWLGLIVLSVVAVWCSYPAAFVLGGIGVLLLLALWRQRGRRDFVPLLAGVAAYGLITGASFLAMYKVYAQPHAAAVPQLAEIQMWQKTFPPLDRPWQLPLWLLVIHTGNLLAYPNGGPNGGSAATLLLVIVGALTLWRRNRPLLVLLLSPLLFNFVAAALHGYPYGGTVRVSLYMAPAFCLLAGLGLFVALRWLPRSRPGARGGAQPERGAADERVPSGRSLALRVPTGRRAVALRVAALVLALFAVGSIATDLIRPYKKDANRRARSVVRDLGREVRPGDQSILFFAITDGVPQAPFIFPWHGDGAQLVFYLSSLVPAPLQFAPPPAEIRPAPAAAGDVRRNAGRTYFVVYHGANFPEIDEQLGPYLAALRERLGEPERREHVLQKRGERVWQEIDVYRFER